MQPWAESGHMEGGSERIAQTYNICFNKAKKKQKKTHTSEMRVKYFIINFCCYFMTNFNIFAI